MHDSKSSSKSSSLKRVILILFITFFAIALIVIISLLLALPPLLSSDFARKNITTYLSKDLQRPVSIDRLSFSWRRGLAISGVTINDRDHSPLLNLNDLTLIISWKDLITGRINIQALDINGIEVTLIRDKSGKTNIFRMMSSSEINSQIPSSAMTVKTRTRTIIKYEMTFLMDAFMIA